jgi:hypothetical protein
VIPKRIAIEIAKDLERLDYTDSLNVLLSEDLNIKTQKILIQETIISDQSKVIANQKTQISLINTQGGLKDDQINYWKKEYKRQKRQKFLTGGIGLGLVVLLALIGG